jgi:hypothetical protein
MFLRTAIVAAALAAAAAPVFAEPAQNARCEATSFRVYFGHNSAALDDATREMLDVAERNVAGCDYAELRIAVDANSAYAQQRADAIRNAANERSWDSVRVEPRGGMQRASYGPEYAEVTMTFERSTEAPAPLSAPNVGA